MYEIWSLGCKPFEDLDGKQVASYVHIYIANSVIISLYVPLTIYHYSQYIEKITSGCRLPPPPGCPRAIYELMIQCW